MAVLVLHTSEGPTLAGTVGTLRRNNTWSNVVFDPSTNEEYIYSLDPRKDRTLKNLPGGVETNNRAKVWQVELVGYAKDTPTQSDAWYRNLASFLVRYHKLLGYPLEFPRPFGGAETYGVRKRTRIRPSEWPHVAGIIGHQHVPENDHWDPGALDVPRLQRFINEILKGDGMTPEEIKIVEIYERFGGRTPGAEEVAFWLPQVRLSAINYLNLKIDLLAERLVGAESRLAGLES